jgi:hypothetical protein
MEAPITATMARMKRFHSNGVIVIASIKPEGPEKEPAGCCRSKENDQPRSLSSYLWTHHGQQNDTFGKIVKKLGSALALSTIHAVKSQPL